MNMKRYLNFSAFFAVILMGTSALVLTSCDSSSKKPVRAKLGNELDSVSYALGEQFGTYIKKDGMDTMLNMDVFFAGLRNSIAGQQLFDETQINTLIQSYFAKMMEGQNAEFEVKEADFLAENAKRPEVQQTSSGLQYEIISEGRGDKPVPGNTVKVLYTGTNMNGDVFDSTEGREPAEFPLEGVIPGWTEGLQLMSVGSKFKFYIPSELAYGPQGIPQAGIGPFEVLTFEVELLGISK